MKNFLKKQLRSVIEWPNPSPDVLLYKFPGATDEIKDASKLIIAPSQGCLLIYEGIVTDHLEEEGLYDLTTDNHPFITSLKKFRQITESEHKLRLYFYRKAGINAQPWGTGTQVKLMDSVYGFPVEFGAHGYYAFKIAEATKFFIEITGISDLYTVDQARQLLLSRIQESIVNYFAGAKPTYTQIDGLLAEASVSLRTSLQEVFGQLGLLLTDFKISGTVFDEATQKRIGQIADITAQNLAAKEGGLSFVEMEKIKALRDAAKNQGGLAGAGLQMGAGLELAKQFQETKGAQINREATIEDKLEQLKRLLTKALISEQEYDAKKKQLLDKL